LADKVVSKIRNGEKFRLILVVPEHPEGSMAAPEVQTPTEGYLTML